MDTSGKVKSRWTQAFINGSSDGVGNGEERFQCEVCQKEHANFESLSLHSQVHVIERKFKCEPCQVSFHSQVTTECHAINQDGHLQKHQRSSAHETRVQMTEVFGIPTSDNPRPFGCVECNTAFRKHGHLAKHLRSKSHITKLESRGLVPNGTFAALDKYQDLKDKLVTTNFEQSLISLREVVAHLFGGQGMTSEQQPLYSNPDLKSLNYSNDVANSLNGPIPTSSAQPNPLITFDYLTANPTLTIQQNSWESSAMSGPSILQPSPEFQRPFFNNEDPQTIMVNPFFQDQQVEPYSANNQYHLQ